MTSPAAPLSTEDEDIFEAANETSMSSIHYSRPATIFAAVAASIFTFVGITGKTSLISYLFVLTFCLLERNCISKATSCRIKALIFKLFKEAVGPDSENELFSFMTLDAYYSSLDEGAALRKIKCEY